jgi:hypothetical protein
MAFLPLFSHVIDTILDTQKKTNRSCILWARKKSYTSFELEINKIFLQYVFFSIPHCTIHVEWQFTT